MADLAKIKRNVGRMVEQNAPESDIDEYIKSEGVTLDAVRAFKGQERPATFDKDVAAARRQGGGVTGLRFADNLSFGAFNPVSAAVSAGFSTAKNALTGKPTDFVGDYKYERDVLDEALKAERKDAGGMGIAADIAISLPFFGGGRAAATAGVAPMVAAAPKNYLGQLADVSKAGAVYGGIYGLNSARGGVGEHLTDIGTNALAGAAFGPALKMGLDATMGAARIPGNAWEWATSRSPAQQAQASEIRQSFLDSGVREFGPAITPSGTQRRTAEGLAGSIFGAPIRREAQGAIDDATRAVQYAVRQPIGNQPLNDAAAEVQGTLRQNLLSRSLPRERIESMTPDELARLTGPIDDRGFSPIPPKVDPIAPRSVDPVMPEPVRPDGLNFERVQPRPVERGVVRPNYPAQEQFVASPEVAAATQGAMGEFQIAQQAAAKARADLERFGSVNDLTQKVRTYAGNNKSALEAESPEAFAAWAADNQAQRGLFAAKRKLDAAQAAEQQDKQQRWVEAVRAEHAKTAQQVEDQFQRESAAAQAEAQRATEANRAAAMRRADMEARAKAEAETAARRAQAEDEARIATEQARTEAQQRFEADRAQRPGFELGRSRETYKTEFDAAYSQLDKATPKFGRNPMGERIAGLGDKRTSTEGLLNEMALELRAAGKLPGYRGVLYSEAGTAIRPGLIKNFRDKFGDEIGDRLEMLIERRAKAQFGLSPQGMRDLITTVRRERQRATRPLDPMSSPDPERAAALTRLEGALKEDYHQFIRDTGAGGERISGMVRNVDEEYRKFVTELRAPLVKLFGDKVEPMAAMGRVAKAAEEGNLHVLRPYMRVMTEKSDPQKGAAAVIAHMTNNAPDLQSFIKGYQSLHPDAKSVLFAGDKGQAMRRSFDRLATVAERLAPFEKAAKGGSIDLTNRANWAVGMTAMANFFPALMMSAGAAATARFMASPRYVEWMARTSSSRTPKQIDVAYGQLASILGKDTTLDRDTKQKIMGAVSEMAGTKEANATFFGENTKGADKAKLSTARQMAKDGKSRDDIWNATGWFKDNTGQWFYEVPDDLDVNDQMRKDMSAKPQRMKVEGVETDVPLAYQLGDVARDAPMEADPRMKKATMQWADMPDQQNVYGMTYHGSGGRPPSVWINKSANKSDDDMVDTMLHERQHVADFVGGIKDPPSTNMTAAMTDKGAYRRIPSEMRAFTTAARRNLTPEERRSVAPLDTAMDVPFDEMQGKKRPPGMMKLGGPFGEASDIFTSLEAPPNADEVRQALANGVKRFDFDLDKPGSDAAVKAIKAAGGKITAYHVGGGGGSAWGGKKNGESVNKYDTKEALDQLTSDVEKLVGKGADYIHFDNTHRMSGRRLEQIADAIKKGGAGFVAKNNPDKWNLVMKRRPDLRPAYAIVENAMHDADETQAAYDLHDHDPKIPVYIIGFKKTIDGSPGVTDDYAKEYKKRNPWASVIIMNDEASYDIRTGGVVGGKKEKIDGMMKLGGPSEANKPFPLSVPAEQAPPVNEQSDRYADMIAKAAKGVDPSKADPQEVIDAAWNSSPTDDMADAIEHIAKRYKLRLPWEK